jgi:hypothetical protein
MPTDIVSPSQADATASDAARAPAHPTFSTLLDDVTLGVVQDIWSAGPNDTWFVTSSEQMLQSSGKILHWTGGTGVDVWESPVPLHAVYGTAPTQVWVVGDSGRIGYFDGGDGFDMLSQHPTSGPLLDTWGDTQNRYVAGDLFRGLSVADSSDLTTYTSFQVGDGRGGFISGDSLCVSGTSAGLWVCGERALYGFDGSWHTILGAPGSASSVSPVAVVPVGQSLALALDPYSVWLVTFKGVATQSAWGPTSLPIPPGIASGVGGPRLTGVWGDSGAVWVVGTQGYVARMTGYANPLSAYWQRIDVGTTRDLEAITADAKSIWIAGDGIVLRADR